MLNQITLIGRLTKDPEFFKKSEDSNPVASFYLAFNQGYKEDGKEDTGFIKCKAFGKSAEICNEWLSKGDKLVVTGTLKDVTYTAKDGSTRHEAVVHINGFEFIDLLKSAVSEEPEEVKEEPKPVAKPSRSRR